MYPSGKVGETAQILLVPHCPWVLMWDALLYAVNIFYYHWLIKKLNWQIARQNRARQEIQTYTGREKDGRVREMAATSRETRCEVTSHEPRGKI